MARSLSGRLSTSDTVRGHALVDLGVYAAAVFMAALFARITGYSGRDFEFGYLIDSLKGIMSVSLALTGAIAGLSFYGSRAGKPHSTARILRGAGNPWTEKVFE